MRGRAGDQHRRCRCGPRRPRGSVRRPGSSPTARPRRPRRRGARSAGAGPRPRAARSDAMVAPTASALWEVMIRESASRSSARTSSPVTRASIASRPPSSRASRSRWPSGEKSMITQSTPWTPARSRSGVQDTSASWVLPSARGSSTRPCQGSPAEHLVQHRVQRLPVALGEQVGQRLARPARCPGRRTPWWPHDVGVPDRPVGADGQGSGVQAVEQLGLGQPLRREMDGHRTMITAGGWHMAQLVKTTRLGGPVLGWMARSGWSVRRY